MKLNFGHLLGFSSLLVAACAAFFSIYGLSQLFAGASIAVIVMASALELSKIISASFLHKYWSKISKMLRIYLTIGVVVLVTITSAGIYGFLSNAYQKTANNLELHNGEIGVIDTKINQIQSKIDNNSKIIEMKTKRLDQLSNIRVSQENRLDGRNNRGVRSDINRSSNDINNLNVEIDKINIENSALMDSISKYNMSKLDLNNKSEVTGEIGPLKYMAELTGVPMNKIVNYFILLLIFVFDPLAIALVIATNWYFEKRRLGELDDLPKETSSSPEPYLIDLQPMDSSILNNKEYFDEVVEENNLELDTPMDIPDEYEESLTGETESNEINNDESTSYTDSSESDLIKPIDDILEPKERKITREDIREIKQREKGFSVPIPKPKNTIERIGQNKYRDNDSNKIFYKKND